MAKSVTVKPDATAARSTFCFVSDGRRKLSLAIVCVSVKGIKINSADEVLERQERRKLSNRDRDVFLALLDADDEPNKALKNAFQAHNDLIAK